MRTIVRIILIVLCGLEAWRLANPTPETDQQVIAALTALDNWGAQQSHSLLLNCHRENGDSNAPWDVQVVIINEGENHTEWDENGYRRLGDAVKAVERSYKKYPNGHENNGGN